MSETLADKLPVEILLNIFGYLSGDDLLSCRLVCSAWNLAGSDCYLWQKKLHYILSHQWSVITCDRQPDSALDLRHANAIHPRQIYLFLLKYVPPHLLKESDTIITVDETLNEDETNEELDDTVISAEPQRATFSSAIVNWWHHLLRLKPFNFPGRLHSAQQQHIRFAVFGPGFDRRATSRLFSKLVDTRTKSFEPVNMISGMMGFGAGLTLRLYAQAQVAAADASIHPAVLPPEPSPPTTKCIPSCSASKSPNLSSMRATGATKHSRAMSSSAEYDLVSKTTSVSLPEDLLFDLLYLYSLQGHLCHNFTDQLDRLFSSRLFIHPAQTAENDFTAVEHLAVTEEMRDLLKVVDGLIYAIDGRETVEELKYLYYELSAVLKGFPEKIAHHIPVVILYIMPKEEIRFDPSKHPSKTAHSTSDESKVIVNRDSYSGAHYTMSWHDSLLPPLSALRLFEFKNPWRLQKCASNDISAVIQTVLWLRSRQPRLS